MEEDYIKLYETEARLLFAQWMKEYKEDPSSFANYTTNDGYGVACQKYLFERHAQL
jgi:hypothetical protein